MLGVHLYDHCVTAANVCLALVWHPHMQHKLIPKQTPLPQAPKKMDAQATKH